MGLEYFGGPRTLNGLVVEDQTFAVASSGTDFNIVSVSGVHTFNLPNASATARGVVTTSSQTIAGVKTFSSDIISTGFKAGNGGLFFPSGYTVLRDFGGNNVLGLSVTANQPVCSANGWAIGANYFTPDIKLCRDAANILALVNGTSEQEFRIYNTFTSATSYERLKFKAVAAANFEIGPENGSGGGTLRGLTIGGYSAGSSTITPWLTFNNAGLATFSGNIALTLAVYQTSEPVNTPAGTTQTITLNNDNHQTLDLTSATGTVTATLTVPSGPCAGTLIIRQHATTARGITWAVSSGSIKWLGTQPTWSSDATNSYRVVSWRWNGSIMFLMSTESGT